MTDDLDFSPTTTPADWLDRYDQDWREVIAASDSNDTEIAVLGLAWDEARTILAGLVADGATAVIADNMVATVARRVHDAVTFLDEIKAAEKATPEGTVEVNGEPVSVTEAWEAFDETAWGTLRSVADVLPHPDAPVTTGVAFERARVAFHTSKAALSEAIIQRIPDLVDEILADTGFPTITAIRCMGSYSGEADGAPHFTILSVTDSAGDEHDTDDIDGFDFGDLVNQLELDWLIENDPDDYLLKTVTFRWDADRTVTTNWEHL